MKSIVVVDNICMYNTIFYGTFQAAGATEEYRRGREEG